MHIFLYNFTFYQVEDISKEPQVERELLLIKLNSDPSTRPEVIMQYLYCSEE